MEEKLYALTIPNAGEIDDPTGFAGNITLSDLVNFFLNIALVLGVVVALVFIIIGGIKWITSEGDEERVRSARNTIIFSIVGLVLIFLSYFIIQFIGEDFLGVSFFSSDSSNNHSPSPYEP